MQHPISDETYLTTMDIADSDSPFLDISSATESALTTMPSRLSSKHDNKHRFSDPTATAPQSSLQRQSTYLRGQDWISPVLVDHITSFPPPMFDQSIMDLALLRDSHRDSQSCLTSKPRIVDTDTVSARQSRLDITPRQSEPIQIPTHKTLDDQPKWNSSSRFGRDKNMTRMLTSTPKTPVKRYRLTNGSLTSPIAFSMSVAIASDTASADMSDPLTDTSDSWSVLESRPGSMSPASHTPHTVQQMKPEREQGQSQRHLRVHQTPPLFLERARRILHKVLPRTPRAKRRMSCGAMSSRRLNPDPIPPVSVDPDDDAKTKTQTKTQTQTQTQTKTRPRNTPYKNIKLDQDDATANHSRKYRRSLGKHKRLHRKVDSHESDTRSKRRGGQRRQKRSRVCGVVKHASTPGPQFGSGQPTVNSRTRSLHSKHVVVDPDAMQFERLVRETGLVGTSDVQCFSDDWVENRSRPSLDVLGIGSTCIVTRHRVARQCARHQFDWVAHGDDETETPFTHAMRDIEASAGKTSALVTPCWAMRRDLHAAFKRNNGFVAIKTIFPIDGVQMIRNESLDPKSLATEIGVHALLADSPNIATIRLCGRPGRDRALSIQHAITAKETSGTLRDLSKHMVIKVMEAIRTGCIDGTHAAGGIDMWFDVFQDTLWSDVERLSVDVDGIDNYSTVAKQCTGANTTTTTIDDDATDAKIKAPPTRPRLQATSLASRLEHTSHRVYVDSSLTRLMKTIVGVCRGLYDLHAVSVCGMDHDTCHDLVGVPGLCMAHRDIKPLNIFVDATGRVVIGDLGAARPLPTRVPIPRLHSVDSDLTSDQPTDSESKDAVRDSRTFCHKQPHPPLIPMTDTMTTKYYEAPECMMSRMTNRGSYDHQVDVWAIGITLIEVISRSSALGPITFNDDSDTMMLRLTALIDEFTPYYRGDLGIMMRASRFDINAIQTHDTYTNAVAYVRDVRRHLDARLDEMFDATCDTDTAARVAVVDLICRCMHPNPTARITASEMMESDAYKAALLHIDDW